MILDKKITDAQLSASGVVSAPDKLTGTAAENKAVFDRLVREAVAANMNGLIDDLAASTGAANIGADFSGAAGETIQDALSSLQDTKVDKVAGKALSTNDYTTAEKTKLEGIEENANNYSHPASHSADMINETDTRKFVTPAEKSGWSAKLDENNVLTKTNTTPFTPTGDYQPATKKYADELALSAGAVTSVFGRSGAVIAQAGDYTPQMVGAAPAASGFSTYTHTKTGSVHALTGNGVHIEFLATADYTQGDTFTVNGAEVTAKLQNGEPLQDKNFTSGSWVSALRLDGAQLTFASGGGGGINDTLAPLHTNFLATGGNARITLSFDEMPQEYSDVYKETHICLSSQRYPQGPNDYDKLVVVQPDGTYVITSKEVT